MTKLQWRTVLIVCTGVFVASLDLFIVNIAFPDVARDFHGTSLDDLSWILNAYAIVFAALLVPAGRWADRVGRKRGFLIGLGLFTLASGLCAVAPSVETLVAARVLQAAGAAILTPASLGLLLPAFPPEKRSVAVGAWAAVSGIAAASGPPLGGLLVQLDWRWVFVVNLPVGVAALIAGARSLDEIADRDAQPADALGSALLIAGLAALVVAIVRGESWGWGSVRIVALFAAAVVLLAAVAGRSARHPSPIIEPAIVGVRSFALAVSASAAYFAAFAAMLLASVLFLTGVWHESVLRAGLEITPGPMAAAIFAVPSARLGERVGPQVVGLVGCLVFALGGVWWLAFCGDTPHYATQFLPGMLIGGAGVGMVNPSLVGAATASLTPQRFATGVALQTMGRQIGSALGVAIFVALLGTPTGASDFHSSWGVMLGGALLAGSLFAAMGRPATAPSPSAPLAATPAGGR